MVWGEDDLGGVLEGAASRTMPSKHLALNVSAAIEQGRHKGDLLVLLEHYSLPKTESYC